jgi:YHS domain-containing protein
MNTFFKTTALAIALAFGTAAGTAIALDQNSTAAINVSADSVILHGYDTVAYHTQGKPVKGSEKFTARHDGATYRFASAANRDKFRANPAKYAPAYGGFCAMGAALGKKLDVDPTQFKVVNGSLYLNVNADVFAKWSQDISGNVAKANRNWPAIKDKAPSAL